MDFGKPAREREAVHSTVRRRAFLAISLFSMLSFFLVNAASAGYCDTLFANTNPNIVTNSFNPAGSTLIYSHLIDLSMLIVTMVLIVLSVVYAIGAAFGIHKLVAFVRAEYMEQILNIIIVVVITASLSFAYSTLNFFSNITDALGVTTTHITEGSGVTALYSSLCTNIMNSQVTPSLFSIIGTFALLIPFEIVQNSYFSFSVGGPLSNYIPQGTVQPFEGIGPMVSVTFLQTAIIFLFLFLGIGVIFLLYIFYFLFPLFLYVGLVLRSLPWTRPAGGSLIALFISFFIIFPSILFPFLALAPTPSTISQNTVCNSSTQKIAFCTGDAGSITLGRIYQLGAAMLSLLAPGGANVAMGNAFIITLQIFAQGAADSALEVLGFGIAFVVAYDMLEMVGDLLGAPSLQSGKLMNKLI